MRFQHSLPLAAALVMAACGGAHKLPEPTASQTEPHVEWAIGAVTSNPDELHVCQSSLRSTCELGASSSRLLVRSAIHLHMHSGDTGAIFSGEMRATFLSAAGGQTTRVQHTLFPRREASSGLTGIVVDKPGTYEFSYTITARGVGVDKKFENRVEVIIR
jgi:hypothetical protein